ncbi:MAG: hypothetical protein F6J95_011635 [Leptolyngbya sp. SIO1E4]|nr:hypothetical protein [Leptolyngbya sp. SIO1E4]
MLKFETPQARQLAEQLMQPALIRIIDNIRKRLEVSDWRGSYQETQLWPEGVEEAQLQRVKGLQAQLKIATPEQADALRAELGTLPQPFPGYELHLTRGDQERIVDVWELCYCVCFEQFPVLEQAVTVDTSLIDDAVNDVDWLVLDNKAKAIVDDIFEQLGA